MSPEPGLSYKELQEQFVSNLNGTSTWEIDGVTCLCVVGVLSRNVALLISPTLAALGPWSKFLTDFLLTILPVQLGYTILSEAWGVLLLSLLSVSLVASVCFCLKDSHRNSSRKRWSLKEVLEIEMSNMRTAITNARAAVLLTTAVSILAVDFVIFPRRFAKTETYGSSLMDGGVGLFTALMGFMSPEARGKNSSSSFGEKIKQMILTVKSSLPLLLLGMGRALSVKSIDYQEHVSEYGVHWNFFFTLAFVKIISAGVLLVVSPSLCGVLAGISPIVYQHLLSSWGLTQLLQDGFTGGGSRHGWIDANREGIVSCLGYLSIYWAGVCVGQVVFLYNRKTVRDWLGLVLQLTVACVVLNILLVVCQMYVEPISRRFANMPYIIWMICAMLQLLVTFMLEDLLMTVLQTCLSTSVDKTSKVEMSFPIHAANQRQCIIASLNYNGLSFFLLANVLTGAVNMSVETIHSSPSTAFLIVTAYMLVLTSASSFMHIKNLKVKFW